KDSASSSRPSRRSTPRRRSERTPRHPHDTRDGNVKHVTHWIGGSPVTGGEPAHLYNPATGEVSGTVDMGTAAQADAAVAAAREAFPAWRDTSLAKRAQVLFRFRELVDAHRDELAALITAEHGKVRSDALGEVARG